MKKAGVSFDIYVETIYKLSIQ